MNPGAVFIAPDGSPAAAAIRAEVESLTRVTTGDLLYVGQIFRARIRKRTLVGVDVNGSPFAPYSTKGPYYFYPNRSSVKGRSASALKARATAAKNRYAKTGKIGVRTPLGIKYESYAAAKAAHGVGEVNLFGMEQHTHMLDTMLVKAGGAEINQSADALDFGSGLAAFESGTPASQLTIGFYGPEAERAQGHNEGTNRLPKREFFALNREDLSLAEKAIAGRMIERAKAAHGGPSGSSQQPPPSSSGVAGESREDWISF